MEKSSIYRLLRHFSLSLVALVVLSACASKSGVNDSGVDAATAFKITQEQLRAYCPTVSLRDGTAFYNSYQKNGQGDPEKVLYQSALRDLTRTCTYTDAGLSMKVAAAGRVVPGPQFKAGTISMPIRVVVLEEDKVIYSKLHKYAVKMDANAQTTQFIFVDDQINLPKPTARNYQVFVGYDIAAK